MLRPRIIPCLLIHKGGLVKTIQFNHPRYVGDPINAVKIFNEKLADEIMVIDIDATVNCSDPNYALIEKLAAECRMPLCYGGGITAAKQVARLVDMGVEKVAVSSAAVVQPSILKEMSSAVGSQSIVAVMDVQRCVESIDAKYEVRTHNGKKIHNIDPIELAQRFQDAGAGEIVVNSIDRDGTMQGYDLSFANRIKSVSKIPTTFLGGAGSVDDIACLIQQNGTVGAAAGSLFVFKGKLRAVLISYPTPLQKQQMTTYFSK
jgi:cyclase